MSKREKPYLISMRYFRPLAIALTLGMVGLPPLTAMASNSTATAVTPQTNKQTNEQASKQVKITGTVVDGLGEPVISASVTEKGSTNGTITDMNGKFTLSVPVGAIVEVSFIGFASQQFTVKAGETQYNITLKEDQQLLEEVVVVGYGVQKKANLTGSVASINAESLESRPVSSVSAAMAGTMPGVTTIQTSGAPGAQSGSITIRGKNSINAAAPLVIVDGVPGSMNNIDPQDIESLSVLKDAASSAIYGVQAANGVILITTKKGKKGERVRVNYTGTVAWTSPTARLKFLGSADYAMLYNEATLNENPDAPLTFSEDDIRKYRDGSSPLTHPNTDWYGETFKKSAMETQHSLSLSGGSENTTYMASLSYLNQQGLSKDKEYERYNGRVNIDSKVSKWLTLGLNSSVTRGTEEDGFVDFGSILQHVNRIPPTFSIYNAEGDFKRNGMDNPVAEIGRTGLYKQIFQQLNATGYAILHPFEGFTLKGVYSLRHDAYDQRKFRKDFSYDTYNSGPREGEHNYYNYNWYTTQLLANYIKSFGNHSITALAGFEEVLYTYRYTTTSRKGGGNDALPESLNTLDASSQKNSDGGNELARRSYFGRFQYDYLSKYLFEFNLRADASSRFPKENRWGVFPAVSAAWRISEEAFLKESMPWVNNLKLRLGWGKTGNEEINALYPSVATYAYGSTMLNNSLYSTVYESRYVNTRLKWATVTNYELGLEAGVLDNRLGFELAVYKKKTDGMLLNLPIEGIIGMSAPPQNAGNVENTGFDLSIFHNNRINSDWSYNINFNVAYVKNRITNMQDTEGEDPNNNKFWFLEGYPIGSFYGYVANGYFNTEEELKSYPKRTGKEKLGDIKYLDTNDDKKITAADRQVIGKNFPSWTAGLNIGITYKNFDLSMLWQGAFDVDAYYTGEAAYAFFNSGKVLERHLDRWTPENHNASYPRLTRNFQDNFTTSSFWVEDASYVRLKNLTLGYNLPKAFVNKYGIEKARVFFSGENLLTFSGLDGLDPESPSDTRGGFYSNVKKVSLGLKLTF
ncbi:MAG: TonB-dependent receptor [Phocaeicola sp.]|nr:TonB-dependent receptor [Prevotellaceae bacterium]MDY5939469.1 TonB-dependent receptor [Phocaeicola sp.]